MNPDTTTATITATTTPTTTTALAPRSRLGRLSVAGLALTTACLAPVSSAPADAADDDGDTISPVAHWDFPDPNINGWFNHPVNVRLDVTDETGLNLTRSRVTVTDPDGHTSGQDEPRTSIEVNVSANGESVISYSVYDLAGNEGGGEAEIYVDTLDPTLATTGLPANGTVLTRGAVFPVGTTCSDDVTGVYTSGIAICGFSSGIVDGRLDTSTPGTLTVSAEASDRAGNVTTSVRHYTVSGTTTPPSTPVKPRNTGLPVIMGAGTRGRVGQDLAGTPGQWTGSPTSYAYQWLRHGVPIEGATQSGYLVQPADAGQPLRIRVTAMNGTKQTRATSRPIWIRQSPPPGKD